MLKENFVFLKEALNEIKHTGALFPTSRWAAAALAAPIRQESRPGLKILELGPGTGSVTVRILEEMQPQDELTVCEINPRFMEILKENLEDDEFFKVRRSRITFQCCPMQELPEAKLYDVVICALPFLNFDMATVQEIFLKLKRLSHRNTVMTYYQYAGLNLLGQVMSLPERRRRMRELKDFFERVFEGHLESRQCVLLNVPPINVFQLGRIGLLEPELALSQAPVSHAQVEAEPVLLAGNE